MERLRFGAVLLLLFTLLSHQAEAAPTAPADACPSVQSTLRTIVWGNVTMDGAPAAAGTVVKMYSPRADVVGCWEVSTSGAYGMTYVYGEDASVSPPIPGMRSGETIAFRVNGVAAAAVPALTWANDWQTTSHQVDLTATAPPPPVAPVVVAGRSGNAVTLTWTHASANVSYQVWRDSAPYFTPGSSGTSIASGMPPAPNCTNGGGAILCTDAGAIGDPASNHFYVIRAFNAAGATADSNRVGEFDFAITPGN